MGKIKLSNDQELNIVADGIQEAGDSLIITLTTEKTITEYDELFSDSNNTRKVTVLDSTGDPFLIHSGSVSYTHLDVYKRQPLWRSTFTVLPSIRVSKI